jgi:hypothetical protein
MFARARIALASVAIAFAALSACGGGGGGTPATTYRISGTVTGASGVTLTLTGGATSTTAADGTYAFAGLAAGTYLVTPSLTGYSFAPASRSATITAADATGVDFTATAVATTHAISGTVSGADAVTVTLSGTASRTTTTGTGGTYGFTGLAAGAYTVTPSLAGYTFAPANRAVSISVADQPGQDFAGSRIVAGTHTISGSVSGGTVTGVTVALTGAASALTTTDAGGHYSFAGLADGAYTVIPSLRGQHFLPDARLATVAGGDLVLDAFSSEALAAWPGLTGSTLAGQYWNGGAWHTRLDGGTALVGAAADGLAVNTSRSGSLVVAPGAVSGQITTVSAAVTMDSSSVTGDTTARTGLDLLFQPLADRVGGTDNQTHALYLRVVLSHTASGGRVALRQAFECTSPDCSTTQGVGTAVTGGTWASAGETVAVGTPYTMSIAFDPATRKVTYTLAGGAYGTPLVTTLDLSAVTTPFTPSLSAASAYRTRLFAQARGGSTGGGNGAVEGRFDDVKLGVDGAAAILFDDFGAGTHLDPAKWTTSEAEVTPVAATPNELRFVLDAGTRPDVNAVALAASPRALQAQVTVTSWTQAGPGQLGARIGAALYNDGSNGLGTAPDVKGASSQVGDVLAQIGMTGTDVSYAVLRCNVAVCSQASGAGHSFLKERTSLGTVAVGEPHVLRILWDAAAHVVSFQLDDKTPAFFDPVAAGSPVAGSPGVPFWQVGVSAGASGTGVEYGTGSSGRVAATFRDLRTL